MTLQDEGARALIRTGLDRTLFVEAGAGSGKTKALVDRLTNLVLVDKIPLRRIAAVTFTEKAAAELRDRLRAELVKQLKGKDDSPELLQALDDLDEAAIGTLHSFAQRLLGRHPIEAGLPPLVEVADEVASQIAFEERWADLRRALLDDEQERDPLLLAMASGVTLEHLRALAKAFTSEWDRLQACVLDPAPAGGPIEVRIDDVLSRGRRAVALADQCTDDSDKLLAHLGSLRRWVDALEAAPEAGSRLQVLVGASDLKHAHGRRASWNCDIEEARDGLKQTQALAAAETARVLDAVLRRLAARIARTVLHDAQERRRSGQLEFHDLLVLSRDLLRSSEHGFAVRASLHETYQRLLLDEFQDTDPIQVELAVRIAAGSEGKAESWSAVTVPAGRLFVVGDPKQSIYRFRRADIATYLKAQDAIGQKVELTTNFRTTPRVLNWVNAVFGTLISAQDGMQPRYTSLGTHRPEAPGGTRVLELGRDPHPVGTKADEVRTAEAREVAETIRTALAEQWQVEGVDGWRDVELDDIAVLVPARTSLPQLEAALDAAGIPYRAEASSLVYRTPEVRDLLMVARSVDDPSDALALVACLRSPLFGCGDDDLWTWKQAKGSFNLLAPVPEGHEDHPVGQSVAWLKRLHRQASVLAPSELLTKVVADRRMLETGVEAGRTRDVWRRLRFVVDHARAWTEAEGGGLRAYLSWAQRQGDEASRVAEAVLPETDAHSVRILTIHAAKGLEFPVVIVSGLSAMPGGNQRGIDVLWSDTSCSYKFKDSLQTLDFEAAKPIDEQMGYAERLRLLYVATTRARDHLVVSLHRAERARAVASEQRMTNAELLATASAGLAAPASRLLPAPHGVSAAAAGEPLPAAPSWADWQPRVAAARASSAKPVAVSPSSLEGGDVREDLELEVQFGLDKGPRNLELPPWNKGRYGTAVGRAVHGVLQLIDLASGAGLDEAVDAQCLAEGVPAHRTAVADLCRSALAMEVIQRAATRRHWRETYVGAVQDDGTLLEGFIDLVYEEDDESLVLVDYKADAVPVEAVKARAEFYAPQVLAYVEALEKATGRTVSAAQLAFVHPGATVRLTATQGVGIPQS